MLRFLVALLTDKDVKVMIVQIAATYFGKTERIPFKPI